MIKYINSVEEFEKEVKGGRCLVDFYATWCGPCKMLEPVLEEIAKTCDVLKIDTDKVGELAVQFGVMSIPTLLYFEDGKEKSKSVGYKNKQEIEEMMK